MESHNSGKPESPPGSRDDELPQCKIKRNYSCNHCPYFTQNPRFHLTHLRDIHGERIVINKCNLCLYASRHYQKLVRHMKMVHGSAEGIAGQSRKRAAAEEVGCSQEQKRVATPPLPPLLYPMEIDGTAVSRSENLSNDLELSRNSLKDIAALYFAENQIGKILSQMEEADAVQLPPVVAGERLAGEVKRKPPVRSLFDEIKNSFVYEGDLKCACGHESKCFSEAIIHRRGCDRVGERSQKEPASLCEASGSTRCQHCRRRCKSSADLVNHLKNCLQYEIFQRSKCRTSSGNTEIDLGSSGIQVKIEIDDDAMNGHTSGGLANSPDEASKKPSAEDKAGGSSVKKVFKCPRCSFWASTASRFHVHIVGHLNKKPFKCSLCTYRSNWRWDITKHIRLKSIRNPCHKNARVLISDDTGRRNYTKYNKFIMLMRLNNEDGDPKLIKTGEMTTNEVASLTSESNLDEDASLDKSGEKIGSAGVDMPQGSAADGKRRVSPPLVRHSDIIDIRTDALTKKTFYRCRKCYFRHANRDAVLAHARIHHQDGQEDHSLSPRSLCMNKVFSVSINMTQKHAMQDHKSHADRNSNPVRGEVTSSTGSLGQEYDAAQDDTEKGRYASSSTSASSSGTSSSIIGNVSKSAMLRVITTTNFGNDASDMRNPSPFRCGHCHQVSNWKHVIQRHCRLKHSGDIRIETLDRSSDGRAPTYRALDFSGLQRSSQERTPANHLVRPMEGQQQATSSAETSALKGDHLQDSFVSSCNSDQEFLMSKLEIPQVHHKSKQHKWPALPQASQDMHSHSEIKCTMCFYTCAKLKRHESSRFPKPFENSEKADRPEAEVSPSKKPRLESGQKPKDSGIDSSPKQETTKTHSFLGAFQDKPPPTAKDSKETPEFTAQKSTTAKTAANPTPVDMEETKPPKDVDCPHHSRSGTVSKTPTFCPHCPFKNDCPKTMQRHLRQHTAVSNSRQAHLCDHCDFTTHSKDELNDHTRLHFELKTTQSSPAFYTSLDKLELTVNDTAEKKRKDDKLSLKKIEFSDPSTSKEVEKTEKNKIMDLQRLRCSGPAQQSEKKSTPPTTNHKTILVNPKTGQVVQRK